MTSKVGTSKRAKGRHMTRVVIDDLYGDYKKVHPQYSKVFIGVTRALGNWGRA